MAALSVGILSACNRSSIETRAWLHISPLFGHVLSIALGGLLAATTIRITRHSVRHWDWARVLHGHLQPAVRGAHGQTLFVLGALGAASEELFFRGLLMTTLGLTLSSLMFGLLHQVRGRARWIWVGWATLMGVLFGMLFLATGSLLGSIFAHATINVVNLHFLRNTELDPPTRKLGGLLAMPPRPTKSPPC